MKNRLPLLLALALLWGLDLAPARAQYIWINVSCKAFRNPSGGQPAPYVSTNLVDEIIRFGNLKLDRYARGYRMRLADPLLLIGSGTPTTSPSDPTRWYDHLAGNNVPSGWDFRADSYTSYPGIYQWNFNALNIYMGYDTNGAGGYCGCPGEPSDPIINLGPQYDFGGFTAAENFAAHIVHEGGHFWSVDHTFGGADCGTNSSAGMTPGDDGISDTLPDVSCWTRDEMSQYHYSKNYAQLTDPNQIQLVNNTYSNLMSYHQRMGWSVLTEPQLDHWADTANGIRAYAVTGRTIFVSPSGTAANSGLQSASPKQTVAGANGAAQVAHDDGTDILLLRPGNYNEKFTLTKRLTLRATRAGWATIGRP